MRSLFMIMILLSNLQAQSFAVVVGIDESITKSKNFKKLTGAVNDAKVFKKLLEESGVKSQNIIYLPNKKATKYDIEHALLKVEQKMVRGRGDKFYYFHAGHGARGRSIGINQTETQSTAILLPYDFTEKDQNSFIVTHNDLLPLFHKIDEKVSFGMLVFDACYSGFAYRGLDDMREEDRYQSRFYDKPIKIDAKKYKLINSDSSYPYQHIIFLASSSEDQVSQEDKIAKRGVFSMALESCLKSRKITTKQSLKSCLDRRYTKQLYVFKVPTLLHDTSNIFSLRKDPLKEYKIAIHSDINSKMLSPLIPLSNFSKLLSATQTLELSKIKGGYLLRELPDGVAISKFADILKLKRYLSNYRLIALMSREESDIDVAISYPNSKDKDRDIVPTDSHLSLTIHSIHQGYLAIFSLDKDGNLYMIEPAYNYSKFYNGMKIDAESTAQAGTDFLKVMIFKKKNNLKQIEVNKSTGEVLHDNKQIEQILMTCREEKFVSTTRKIITSKGIK